MALRIHRTVVRGEIDNRERGFVRGTIWLVGRDQPVALQLKGNCWRDLAGCLVRFENPEPEPAKDERAEHLATKQNGVTGDMTVSRKVRVFDVGLEETLRIAREGGIPPEHMANSLYIEWFSDANGRVVIESADYKIEISEASWTISREEEQEQIVTTQQAMRDWLDRLVKALQSQELDGPEQAG
jgi:hypothetical protein